jgi:hypothetical protein
MTPNPSIEPTCFGRSCPPAHAAHVKRKAMGHSPRSTIAALWVAVATAFVLGIAGCAAELGPKPSSSPLEAAPYVGVFTGEFVDGKPLYRLPAILVIGSRSSVGPDI